MDGIFKALGDPTRLRIVRMLAENGEVCVCRIVEELGMQQPAISHHMARLKQAGLLQSRKQEQWIYYSLNIERLKTGPFAFLSEVVSLAENVKPSAEAVPCCE